MTFLAGGRRHWTVSSLLDGPPLAPGPWWTCQLISVDRTDEAVVLGLVALEDSPVVLLGGARYVPFTVHVAGIAGCRRESWAGPLVGWAADVDLVRLGCEVTATDVWLRMQSAQHQLVLRLATSR